MSTTYDLSFVESSQCPVLQIKSLHFRDRIGYRSQLKNKVNNSQFVPVYAAILTQKQVAKKRGLI